ncbi:hypothetical protein C8Q80DRAFT_1122723 [Daedaleopsis nitida]|nr:hypothetical protein C8Q80DRAFT_1122723 [Daedaleopsis nitida]
MAFLPFKARSMFSSSSSPSSQTQPNAPPPMRPSNTATPATLTPLTPPAPAHRHGQPSPLATLQYQQDLLADFWSGSAARTPRPPRASSPSPPPRSSSSTHSHSRSYSETHESVGRSGSGKGMGKGKTKWAQAIQVRERRAHEEEGLPEPRTAARTMFLFGFLCPLLWFAGAVLLFFPRTPAVEMAHIDVAVHSERSRRAKAEERWARRCLWACVCVLAAVPVVVLGVVLARRHA